MTLRDENDTSNGARNARPERAAGPVARLDWPQPHSSAIYPAIEWPIIRLKVVMVKNVALSEARTSSQPMSMRPREPTRSSRSPGMAGWPR